MYVEVVAKASQAGNIIKVGDAAPSARAGAAKLYI